MYKYTLQCIVSAHALNRQYVLLGLWQARQTVGWITAAPPGPAALSLVSKPKQDQWAIYLSIHLSILMLESSVFTQLGSNPKACLISLKIPTHSVWVDPFFFTPWFDQRAKKDKSVLFETWSQHLSLIRRFGGDGSHSVSSLKWTEGNLGQPGLRGSWFVYVFVCLCVFVFYMWCCEEVSGGGGGVGLWQGVSKQFAKEQPGEMQGGRFVLDCSGPNNL